MSANKPVFLDVDSTIVEKNLRFTEDPNDEISQLFGPKEPPSKIVKPSPGFCVKTKEVGTDTKVFVNVCQTDGIPPPKDISTEELQALLDTDECSDYRVPMSIGEIHIEKDKKDQEAKVCDIAINPSFYIKMESTPLFKNFFFAIVFQALTDKYGLVTADEKVILQNKKTFGTLQSHRIQKREIEEKMGAVEKKSLMEELTNNNEGATKPKPKIEMISSVENEPRVPDYRLFKKKGHNCLFGEFKFPDIISEKELTLDVGEDRLILESKSKGYLLDIFVPYIVRQQSTSCTFERKTKILTVTMPLMGG